MSPPFQWFISLSSVPAGNAFDPLEKAEEFGLDALKYFLLRESSFSDDGVCKCDPENVCNTVAYLSLNCYFYLTLFSILLIMLYLNYVVL